MSSTTTGSANPFGAVSGYVAVEDVTAAILSYFFSGSSKRLKPAVSAAVGSSLGRAFANPDGMLSLGALSGTAATVPYNDVLLSAVIEAGLDQWVLSSGKGFKNNFERSAAVQAISKCVGKKIAPLVGMRQ